jgi:RimJ/RimL family protein N-acetyltransferase
MCHFWRDLANFKPDDWTLPLGVFHDGTIIGTQTIKATNFALLKEIRSGSWLGVPYRGHGHGTAMRSMILQFAFQYLGAVTARSGALDHNHASARISQKLGYQPDGDRKLVVAGQPRTAHYYRLTHEAFTHPQPSEVEGLEACRHLLIPA